MNFIMVDHVLLQSYGFTMRNCKIILAYINMEIGELGLVSTSSKILDSKKFNDLCYILRNFYKGQHWL
jgi:hypothetical protein